MVELAIIIVKSKDSVENSRFPALVNSDNRDERVLAKIYLKRFFDRPVVRDREFLVFQRSLAIISLLYD